MTELVESILYIVGLLLLATILLGGPVMILWNWLMPTIFGLPDITFWQACGLNIMSALLFKPITKTNKD